MAEDGEKVPEREIVESSITAEEVADRLRNLQAEGHAIDFEDSDLEHLADMPPDELAEYYLTALLSAGLDPEDYLSATGMAEDEMTRNTPAILEIQRRRSTSGQGYVSGEADAAITPDRKIR